MPRDRGEPPAVRVYTVCDESRYLIVRNVPALGCGDELGKLFASYGDVEECKPMDAENSGPFTDVFWIKFSKVNNARFAKRKLDEFVFYGNQLQVSYAPEFETVLDTQEKLEGRRKEVLARIRYAAGRIEEVNTQVTPLLHGSSSTHFPDIKASDASNSFSKQGNTKRAYVQSGGPGPDNEIISHVSSNQDYFSSSSMNKTVQFVREKLDKIESSSDPPSKKSCTGNRRRI